MSKKQFCVYEMQGKKYSMEDKSIALSLGPDIDLFAVFDGHGGSSVSNLLEAEFPQMVTGVLKVSDSSTLINNLTAGFRSLDNVFSRHTAGSTATGALIIQNDIYVFNLGDSRTYVLDNNYNTIFETLDHKPGDENETFRIKNSGGYVERNRVNGILAVSRAFGDSDFKRKTDDYGDYTVSSTPDIRHVRLESGYVVIGCDGVWDVLNMSDIENEVKKLDCKGLVQKAFDNLSSDNISAIIVKV